jgi:hypothetical protein
MKKIPINKGLFCLVDDEDYEFLSQWKWTSNAKGYVVRTHREKMGRGTYTEHIIMHRVINNTPDGMVTDHINGDRLDNRRCNLRSCTVSQNNCNRIAIKGKTSSYKGVSLCKRSNKWRAQILGAGSIGYYETEIEAAKKYDEYALKQYGEYAKLNFGGGF